MLVTADTIRVDSDHFFCRNFIYKLLLQQLLDLVLYVFKAFFSLERFISSLHSFEGDVIIAAFGGSILTQGFLTWILPSSNVVESDSDLMNLFSHYMYTVLSV